MGGKNPSTGKKKEIHIAVKGTKLKKIEEFKEFQGNLKTLRESEKTKLKNSILENGFNAPLFTWLGHNFILDGHQRLIAVKELLEEGHTLKNKALPYIEIEAETREQAAGMVLTYNSQYGHMKESGLLEFVEEFNLNIGELKEITNLELDLSRIDFDMKKEEFMAESGSLKRDFVAPPFSVLDTKQGDWKLRKQKWMEWLPELEETREETLSKESENPRFTGTTSVFDPALAEVMYAWFAPKEGHVLDTYMGECTKALVAASLELEYTGIEIRKEQFEENNKHIKNYSLEHKARCLLGDAKNVTKLCKGMEFDFAFTSPPYYDLEVYSKEEGDISAKQTYIEFLQEYFEAIDGMCSLLKPKSFAAIKVSEIRNKKTGIYRNFVADTIAGFQKAGMQYWNEIILVNAIGSLPLRVRRSFEKSKKVGRTHQNILVFRKP